MNKLLTTMIGLAVASVTAFHTTAAFAQEVTGNVENGQKKVAMCIGCHGIVGYQSSFPEVHKVPKISGQSAKYIAAALNAYKAGERKHPTMRGIADSLNDQDIADVSAYYAQHGKAANAPEVPAEPARKPSAQVDALLKKGACVSCHGTNFAKPIDPAYPHIAGQHADYLFVALKSYKQENNAKVGRTNGVMAGVAKQFSNAELKAMANYISSLDGDLKVVPQSEFRR
ncbi:c-type cytochrome [Variovorax sp. VNK109]|jgi:cytochrome c553|uniref:c-type cytochrome n=1 Tax=Variovorax sp. VNK109 TaxID=3400919 RepID=UPI003C086933